MCSKFIKTQAIQSKQQQSTPHAYQNVSSCGEYEPMYEVSTWSSKTNEAGKITNFIQDPYIKYTFSDIDYSSKENWIIRHSVLKISEDKKFLFCLHGNRLSIIHIDTLPRNNVTIDHAKIDENYCIDIFNGYCHDENSEREYEIDMHSLYDPRLSTNPLLLIGFGPQFWHEPREWIFMIIDCITKRIIKEIRFNTESSGTGQPESIKLNHLGSNDFVLFGDEWPCFQDGRLVMQNIEQQQNGNDVEYRVTPIEVMQEQRPNDEQCETFGRFYPSSNGHFVAACYPTDPYLHKPDTKEQTKFFYLSADRK